MSRARCLKNQPDSREQIVPVKALACVEECWSSKHAGQDRLDIETAKHPNLSNDMTFHKSIYIERVIRKEYLRRSIFINLILLLTHNRNTPAL